MAKINIKHWLEKAVLTKAQGKKYAMRQKRLKQKGLDVLLEGDGVMLGSDNHRAHFWFDDSFKADPAVDSKTFQRLLDFNKDGREGVEICEFSTYSLKKACDAARAYFKKAVNYARLPAFIYVYAGKDAIEFETSLAEVGSMQFSLKNGDVWKLKKSSHDLFYHFAADEPVHFYIDPEYFKQALQGMGKSATLRKNGDLIYLKGESGAEAVVMAMQFSSFERTHKPREI